MKREASQKTLTRRHAINNLDNFEMAVLNLKNIKITKISEEEVSFRKVRKWKHQNKIVHLSSSQFAR